ncbi:MAG: DNA recombination protein RmuC [Chitinophagia bacterium]|jgi:DNA recombination protein RmuC|nr:DNA recombination protein RmuC [Chitinophagia bacterium]
MEMLNLVLLAIVLLVLLLLFFKKKESGSAALEAKIAELEKSLSKIETALREDFRINREENDRLARENRTELATSLSKTGKEQVEKLEALMNKIEANNRDLRSDIEKAFKVFADAFDKSVRSFNDLQREKFAQLEEKQTKLVDSTEKRLDQMRETVEEKLQKTLNERLGHSFEMVNKQLQSVQEGLGDMKNLANDVGGLKKVLSNVKMRGGLGEVQLSMLLEQILAPDQYAQNVKTKEGSTELVEFAIKLPGRDDDQDHIWLPIDAKFPADAYEQLQTAYDVGDPAIVELAQKNMENVIKKMARDISDKYLDPPHTTDFGIMFLPFEGIYAEVVRKASLLEELQKQYKVIVTGPTTLAAILNSLQMGFRTLALQQRSSEVWKVLGAVKTEFEKFGGLLQKAQKNINAASDTVEELLGKRSKAISRKLKDVEALPASEAQQLLPDMGLDLEDDGDQDA